MSSAFEWPVLVDGRVATSEEGAELRADATATSVPRARPRDDVGVFETIRCEDGRAFELAAHLARLECGVRALGIAWPLARDVRADLERYMALVDGRDAALRVSASTRLPASSPTSGDGSPRATCIVAGRALPAISATGRALAVARVRVDPDDRSTRIKGTSRTRWDDALSEARALGADDALFLTLDGDVAETAVANVFARFGDVLRTPPLGRGLLAGIARAAVLEVAAAESLRADEARLTLAELASADEVLVTNALVRAVGIARIFGVREDFPGERSELPRALRARLAARHERAEPLFFRR